MQESKLTNFQQRQLNQTLKCKICARFSNLISRHKHTHTHTHTHTHSPTFSLTLQGGHSLPLRCHPTSSHPDGQPATRSKKSSSQKVKAPKQSGLRTKETIEHLTVADQEPEYRPSPSSKSQSLLHQLK